MTNCREAAHYPQSLARREHMTQLGPVPLGAALPFHRQLICHNRRCGGAPARLLSGLADFVHQLHHDSATTSSSHCVIITHAHAFAHTVCNVMR